MMFDFIEPWAFLLALGIGLFYTYLTTPYPRTVYKYPTPYNAGKITYMDDANVCYKYRVKKVQCPADQSKIKELSLQTMDQNSDNI